MEIFEFIISDCSDWVVAENLEQAQNIYCNYSGVDWDELRDYEITQLSEKQRNEYKMVDPYDSEPIDDEQYNDDDYMDGIKKLN